jgi:long-chain acyl-CoA synthetase
MTDPTNLGAFVDREGDPNRPIIIGAGLDGSETIMSRLELDTMANGFARGLLRNGIVRGDRIAILSANRAEYVVCLLGAMRAGIVATPLNFKFPAAGITSVIADCGARMVLFDEPRRALLAGIPSDIPIACFDDHGEGGLKRWLDPGPFDPIVPQPDEAALCLYTSGSTGRPKGVLLSHAAHLWVVRTRMAESNLKGERVLIAAPLYHMNALALMLLVAASGSTAVLMPQFQAVRYIDAISRYRCTWLTAVPPMIAMMMREKEALKHADLSSVRTLRMGSAPVNDTLVAETRALLPNARIINAYGTTEGGPIVFTGPPPGALLPTGSLGKPHPQVQVRLVGPDAPDMGVLQMKSPAIMLGYHNRPDVKSPVTEDGYYDTGDVFRRDADGYFFFVGRSDDMFVSGGENIFPGEVESVLESHPEILQACVVPVADDIKGSKPVAFVVRRQGSTLDEESVKQYVLANAPAYQHPRRVWFLDTMLLAATNKIDRNALRLRAEANMRAEQ